MTINTSQQNNMWLYKAVLFLFVIQPVLDVISYWLDVLKADNTVTLALRFVLLVTVIAIAWAISSNKKTYIATTLIAIFMIAAHIIACSVFWGNEYNLSWIFSDVANYFRVFQLPFFAFAIITAFNNVPDKDHLYDTIELAVVINLVFIALIELISTITGSDPHTYPNKSLGVLGWFYFANSQSAILCALVPITLVRCYRRNSVGIFTVFAVLSFALLFLFGTRLTFLGIFVIGIGLVITFLSAGDRKMNKTPVIVIICCLILSAACFKIAPFYVNQSRHQDILQEEQEDIDKLLLEGKELYGSEGYNYLLPAYEKYLGGLVSRFGFDVIAEEYGYSEKASEIIDWRRMKLVYNDKLMDKTGGLVHAFGLPLDSLTYEDYIYDVENDWHGLYYLFGWTGLILMAMFIAGFIILILKSLIIDFHSVFTVRAGAVGLALIMLLIHAYFTAGVLRRPNASFYVSVCLALSFYLVKLKGGDENG